MLHHTNVVKLLFAIQTPFALDLLLEVCDSDLRTVLRRWDMTVGESKDAIRHISQGLEYIHDRNVVHRDVKAANMLGDVGGPFGKCCTASLWPLA